jgi:hypothetical protein
MDKEEREEEMGQKPGQMGPARVPASQPFRLGFGMDVLGASLMMVGGHFGHFPFANRH